MTKMKKIFIKEGNNHSRIQIETGDVIGSFLELYK